jgi:hypothetical protein
MKIAQLMWVGSAALGVCAALALHFTVSSAPMPPAHPSVINARISDAWQALNHKSDRLPLAARWKLPAASEELAPVPVETQPAREIVQLGPTVMAVPASPTRRAISAAVTICVRFGSISGNGNAGENPRFGAGNRAIWFDKAYRDAVFVDIRPEVSPDIVADNALPAGGRYRF